MPASMTHLEIFGYFYAAKWAKIVIETIISIGINLLQKIQLDPAMNPNWEKKVFAILSFEPTFKVVTW